MKDVLIVGAGASGLMAGYDLKRVGGYNVTILEASSHLGGRLQKLQSDDSFSNYPIDLGGEWIHVPPTILDLLVDDPSVNVNVETIRYTPLYSVLKANGEFTSEYVYDSTTDYFFLNYSWHDFFNDYIGQSVANDIVYDCVVSAIDYSATPVVMTCKDGRTFSADYGIVTVPLAVLQDGDIDFTPNLPESHENAIQSPIMPSGLKVFLKFTNKFYRESFEYQPDFPLNGKRYYYDESWGQDTTDNILGMFSIGEIADDSYISLSDEEIIASILDDLDWAFEGQASSSFIQGHVQNWNNEPFIRGTYSYEFPDGYWPIRSLRQPLEDRIWFAGEAIPVDEEHGFAHGAALSGRRAAGEIINLNGGPPPSTSSPGTSEASFLFKHICGLAMLIVTTFHTLF